MVFSVEVGDLVGLVLDCQFDVSCGDWIVMFGFVLFVKYFLVILVWLDIEVVKLGCKYWVCYGNCWVQVCILVIDLVLDIYMLQFQDVYELLVNIIGCVQMEVQYELLVEFFVVNCVGGVLIVVDLVSYCISGVLLVDVVVVLVEEVW